MEEKDFIKNEYNELFSSFNFNENAQINNLEKSPNSSGSFKLSTPLIKDIKDIKNIKENNTKNTDREIKVGNYLIKKTLGKGTFGRVKLAIFLPQNKKVAIKIIEKKRIREEDDIIRLKREFEMLSQFNHPNVITVSEIFESREAYFTVMEFCEGGELFNYIVSNKCLSEEKSAYFYYQLISGLEYIHSLGIVHRDLKPENLLLTHEKILKIIDFGLSNYFKNDQIKLLETPCGSPCYASPEMLSGNSYDGYKIDIWATGIILFAMLCGYLPFDDKNNNILFQKILECKIKFPQKLSVDAKDLLKKILVANPDKRISIPEIKKHPFFLKGKKIFEKCFTIINPNEIANSENSSYCYDYNYMEDNFFTNNLLFYDSKKKSEIILNKLLKEDEFFCRNFKKRNFSCEIYNAKNMKELSYESKNKKGIIKKLVNLEKKFNKFNKEANKKKETNNIFLERNKFILENNNNQIKDRSLNYNNSITLHIKDITSFIENLIINYKIEEELQKINEHNKNINTEKIENKKKSNKNDNKKTKSEDNKINANKYHKKIKNNYNKIKKSKISLEKDKFCNSSNEIAYIKTKRDDEIKKNIENMDFLKTQPNNKLFKKTIINPIRKKNFNNLNKKIIIDNIKKKESTKINKLFINNNKIVKINKLTNTIKLKKPKRKIRSSSNNNSNKKSFQQLLNKIKEQTNINLVNKNNVINHYITNITNMTQRNYFSNVIINNFKYKDKQRVNSTSKNKSKILFDIPILKVNKNINLKTKPSKKNSNLKKNLHNIIFKDENILKNSIKINSKTIINFNDDEVKNQIKSKNTKLKKKSKEKEAKTLPIMNDKKKQYKIKVSFINNFNINTKGYNKNIYLNTDNSIRNSSINKDKYLDKKKPIYNEKKNTILLTDINVEEEAQNRSKLNFINSIENSYSNRSNNKTLINSLEKKINNNNSNRQWNKSRIKKFKKNNLKFQNLLFKKLPKLNIKNIIGNNIILKTEPNSLKEQKQINSQRNKTNAINNNKKLFSYRYLYSARNNDKKYINTSYNIGNNHYLGNLADTNPLFNNRLSKLCKLKTSQNNIRNKNMINNNNFVKNNYIVNITNDNIRINSSKNKSLLNSNNDININSILINKNNINKIKKNIYLNKFLISKKLLSSLRKRINLKSAIINSFYDKKYYRTHKNSIKNGKINENKNKINNNSEIINFQNNLRQVKNNNINDNKKITDKTNLIKNNDFLRFKTEIYNSLYGEKIKHKKIKSMKDTLFNIKYNTNTKKLSNPLLNK